MLGLHKSDPIDGPSLNPHLLFEKSKFDKVQSELLEFFLDLTGTGEEIRNFNNTKPFDELLYHLETSFTRNYEYGENKEIIDSYLKIPSVVVLHLLLTLASRCPRSNWTKGGSLFEGIQSTHEYVQTFNHEYDNCVYKPPLKDRSLYILQKYLDVICSINRGEELKSSTLQIYKNLLTVLNDTIIRRPSINTRPQFKSPTKRKKPSNGSSKSNKIDITSMFKSKFQKTKTDSDTNDKDDEPQEDFSRLKYSGMADFNDEVISNSEDEEDILGTDMVEEILKYKGMNQTPLKTERAFQDSISSNNKASVLFQSMSENYISEVSDLKMPASNNLFISSRISNPSIAKINLFDEELLAISLNRSKRYNLWSLMQWMFSCADKSTKYQKYLFDSAGTSYHSLYLTYKGVLQFIFKFTAINFLYELNNLLKSSASPGDDLIERFENSTRQTQLLSCMNNDNRFLLLLIVTQLGISPNDWHDRAVEYLFTGLEIPSSYEPQPCYEREKLLIKQDSSLINKGKGTAIEYDDNVDSMGFRYEALLILYIRSLFFDSNDIEDNPTAYSGQFIKLLGNALLKIKFKYFEAFFKAHGNNSISVIIPKKYEKKFIFCLIDYLITEITKLVEIYDILPNMDDSSEEIAKSVEFFILEEYIYQSVTDDVTHESWEGFKCIWLKLNFLIATYFYYQIMDIGLNDFSSDFIDKIEKLDNFRIDLYNAFIEKHSSKSTFHDDYNFMIDEKDKDRYLITNTSEVPWVNFKLLVDLKLASQK